MNGDLRPYLATSALAQQPSWGNGQRSVLRTLEAKIPGLLQPYVIEVPMLEKSKIKKRKFAIILPHEIFAMMHEHYPEEFGTACVYIHIYTIVGCVMLSAAISIP